MYKKMCIEQFAPIPKSDFQFFLAFFSEKHFSNGDYLLHHGEINALVFSA